MLPKLGRVRRHSSNSFREKESQQQQKRCMPHSAPACFGNEKMRVNSNFQSIKTPFDEPNSKSDANPNISDHRARAEVYAVNNFLRDLEIRGYEEFKREIDKQPRTRLNWSSRDSSPDGSPMRGVYLSKPKKGARVNAVKKPLAVRETQRIANVAPRFGGV